MKLAALALVLVPTVAFADDTYTGGSGGGGSGGLNTYTISDAGTAIWSPQLIRNPATLNKSGIEVFGSFAISRVTHPATMMGGMDTVTTEEGLMVGGAYGITDRITGGLTYTMVVHDPSGAFPGDAKGPLDVYGGYNIKHKTKYSLSAGADFAINVGNTDQLAINLGASFKYYLSDQLAVYTGNILPAGPVGQQLTIGLGDKDPIALRVPAGIAFQITPMFFAYLETQLFDVHFHNGNSGVIFADFIPVTLGVFYHAATNLDVGVSFGDDFKNAGDAYAIALTALVHL
ncbi:MAG TPA: hypothetical protein VL123_08075 [Candidatus Udaeobacter sp.]|nr:hypothetical protein [Candidatus Udaeobacter sp.]